MEAGTILGAIRALAALPSSLVALQALLNTDGSDRTRGRARALRQSLARVGDLRGLTQQVAERELFLGALLDLRALALELDLSGTALPTLASRWSAIATELNKLTGLPPRIASPALAQKLRRSIGDVDALLATKATASARDLVREFNTVARHAGDVLRRLTDETREAIDELTTTLVCLSRSFES